MLQYYDSEKTTLPILAQGGFFCLDIILKKAANQSHHYFVEHINIMEQ